MYLLLKQPRQFKFNVLGQLGHSVGWPLRHLGPQLGVIIRQAKLKEIVVVNVAIPIFVESVEESEEVRILTVIYMVLPKETAEFF